MTIHEYYSRGKLMISGEYLVLHGATALAIPTRFGQKMQVNTSARNGMLSWKTSVLENDWFQAEFAIPGFEPKQHNNAGSAAYIVQVLKAAKKLNPGFLASHSGYQVECRIDFDIQWGLGSSSSLISNVAYWAGVDALALHSAVSKGSGYDVACARSSKPILYTNAGGKIESIPVDLKHPFSQGIYFIYLGRKQDSQKDVDVFMGGKNGFEQQIKLISSISRKMVNCTNYENFGKLMREHEEIMSKVLGKPTLKSTVFSDFPGEVKSLGAWGGDFAMALWPHSEDELREYLSHKNLNTCFKFNEMMYDPE